MQITVTALLSLLAVVSGGSTSRSHSHSSSSSSSSLSFSSISSSNSSSTRSSNSKHHPQPPLRYIAMLPKVEHAQAARLCKSAGYQLAVLHRHNAREIDQVMDLAGVDAAWVGSSASDVSLVARRRQDLHRRHEKQPKQMEHYPLTLALMKKEDGVFENDHAVLCQAVRTKKGKLLPESIVKKRLAKVRDSVEKAKKEPKTKRKDKEERPDKKEEQKQKQLGRIVRFMESKIRGNAKKNRKASLKKELKKKQKKEHKDKQKKGRKATTVQQKKQGKGLLDRDMRMNVKVNGLPLTDSRNQHVDMAKVQKIVAETLAGIDKNKLQQKQEQKQERKKKGFSPKEKKRA